MKSKFLLFIFCLFLVFAAMAQNVGIGTTTPLYKLDVNGTLNTAGDCYVGGFMGVDTKTPIYKITVQDGSVALYNSVDLKYWVMSYSSGGKDYYISEDGSQRLVIANGGNVGIGTTVPSAKLEVAGSEKVSGSLTVNNNKGVLYNLSGSTNIKYYTRSAGFSFTNLAAHSFSPEASIGFIGGFSNAPAVYVGNIVSSSSSSGLFLQLVIYDVTATNCKCRIFNNSNSAVTSTITWNIVCMGN
jgi:hypothetical protein